MSRLFIHWFPFTCSSYAHALSLTQTWTRFYLLLFLHLLWLTNSVKTSLFTFTSSDWRCLRQLSGELLPITAFSHRTGGAEGTASVPCQHAHILQPFFCAQCLGVCVFTSSCQQLHLFVRELPSGYWNLFACRHGRQILPEQVQYPLPPLSFLFFFSFY